LFAIVQAAGWPIWFLLLASVIAVALIIGALSRCAPADLPPDLFDQVVSVSSARALSQVIDRLSRDSPLGAVLAAGYAT
jgi:biopolymer transport protein ExbB